MFDTFGTVVDWRSGISSAVRAFAADRALTLDPGAFADAWRARYEPSKELVRSGQRRYASLDTLHRENLDAVLRSHDIDPGAFAPGELTSLTAAWHYLPPWPDSAEGIRQLKRDFIVGPLSSGHTALLVNMAKAAGLPWDVILGSDISRAYKPSLDAYRKPAALLGSIRARSCWPRRTTATWRERDEQDSRPHSSPVRPNTAPVKSRTWPPLITGM